MGKAWYAIQTRAGKEDHIVLICRARVRTGGESVFTMKKEMVKKIRGEWRKGIYPLFPGYVIFETEDIDDLFFRLKKVPELTKIVRTGELFTPLYPEEEYMLKRLGGEEHILRASLGFVDGDLIRVFEGPLKGLEGSISKVNRHKSIAVIETMFLGEKRQVSVALELVAHEKAKKLKEILETEERLVQSGRDKSDQETIQSGQCPVHDISYGGHKEGSAGPSINGSE